MPFLPADMPSGMTGMDRFEFLTGRRLAEESDVDRLVAEGVFDPSEAEGWSMGYCMDAVVARISATQRNDSVTGTTTQIEFLLASRLEMLEAIDIPDGCRLGAVDLKETDVKSADAPPHIHDRRGNWKRRLCIGHDKNYTCPLSFVHVFYENLHDGALYAGNVTSQDIQIAAAYHKDNLTPDITFKVATPLVDAMAGHSAHSTPDPEESAVRKRACNRAKRTRNHASDVDMKNSHFDMMNKLNNNKRERDVA